MLDEKLIVIPVDGTTGSGKSYLGMKFAEALGFQFVDSGWVFRVAALAALEEKIDLTDEDKCVKVFNLLDITCETVRSNNETDHILRVGGLNVTRFLSERRIDMNASLISKHPKVREQVKKQYLKLIKDAPTVLVGRDIGTVIFPEAKVKFYVNANLEVRAQRRLKQRNISPESYNDLKNEIAQRDIADSTREHAPLKKAEDAIEIFNNGSVEDAIGLMVGRYREKKN